MNEQMLSKLGRKELLNLLLEVTKEKDELKVKLDSMQEKIDSREIQIGNCGSIAEAALQLNNVFTNADKAAKEYLDNVKRMQDEISTLKQHAEEEYSISNQKCLELEENTRKKCALLEEETTKKCEAMLAKARDEVNQYNQNVVDQMSQLKAQYESMLSVFSILPDIKPMVDQDE